MRLLFFLSFFASRLMPCILKQAARLAVVGKQEKQIGRAQPLGTGSQGGPAEPHTTGTFAGDLLVGRNRCSTTDQPVTSSGRTRSLVFRRLLVGGWECRAREHVAADRTRDEFSNKGGDKGSNKWYRTASNDG